MKYKIIRFRQNGSNEIMRTGLTLEEAKEHCSKKTTESQTWFDGYTKEQ